MITGLLLKTKGKRKTFTAMLIASALLLIAGILILIK